MICPKCKHARGGTDDPEIPDYQCPACGVIYAKYTLAMANKQGAEKTVDPDKANGKAKRTILDVLKNKQQDNLKSNKPVSRSFLSGDNTDLSFMDVVIALGGAVIIYLIFSYGIFLPMVVGVGIYFAVNKKYLYAFLVLIVAVIAQAPDSTDKRAIASASKPAAPVKSAAQLKQEEEACKKDLNCFGKKVHGTQSGRCISLIENKAKYSFKWTDGFFEPKFREYRWKWLDKKVIMLMGDKIQFQNAFGAMQNYIYYCDINVDTEKVIGVQVAPGRI